MSIKERTKTAMRYIRTKDGRITTLKDELMDNPGLWILGGKENILEIVDTIEDLFDEFRGIWINYYESEKKDAHEEYHYDKEKNVFYNDFEELTPEAVIEKFDIFYGAIWTNSGLIYKAKMKGILPNGEIDWELL